MRMRQNGEKMKKRKYLSVLLCLSLFFASGCAPKAAEQQPTAQETADQADETKTAEQGTASETASASDQEEAADTNSAATVLPMLVDYHYEAEYAEDSYETLISARIPKVILLEDGHDALRASLEEWNQKLYESQMSTYETALSDNRDLWDAGEDMPELSVEGDVTFTRTDSDILSYYEETSEWLGGAHPFSYKETCTYDVKSGKSLNLSDVVSDYDAFYQEMCAQLETMKEENGFFEDYQDTVQSIFYGGESNDYGEPLWTLSDDNLTVYFDTYMLAPYAAGEQTVSFSFTEYPDLIQKQYQKNSEEWSIAISEDETCLLDLDGDGTEEEISYSADRDEYGYADSVVISCNGNRYDTAKLAESDYGGYGYSTYGYLIRTRNGKTWLYLETLGDSDSQYLQIFELMKDNVKFVTGEYLGLYRNQVLDPESFVMSRRFDILGTYEAYKVFHVKEDGFPETEDLLWTVVAAYTDWKVELTSSIDLELSVREAQAERGSGQVETLPAGTHFVLLKTDGETYAEARLDDGRICEFELQAPSGEEWEGKINGISVSDCFEYVPYAG